MPYSPKDPIKASDLNKVLNKTSDLNTIKVGSGLVAMNFPGGVFLDIASSPPTSQEFIRVYCTQDGGSYGDGTTTCDATYTVTDLNGNNLKDGSSATANNKIPEWNWRLPLIAYYRPSGSGICIACYDLAKPPNLHLLFVPEMPQTVNCVEGGS